MSPAVVHCHVCGIAKHRVLMQQVEYVKGMPGSRKWVCKSHCGGPKEKQRRTRLKRKARTRRRGNRRRS